MMACINQQIYCFSLFYCKGKECKSWLLKWIDIALFNFTLCVAHNIICLRPTIDIYKSKSVCASYKKKKILPSWLTWCGTFWNDFSLLRANTEAGWTWCCSTVPGTVTELITAGPFRSVLWHPAHKELRV